MKKYKYFTFIFFLLSASTILVAQTKNDEDNNSFWKKVHFGGGFQMSIGNGYTALGISPSAIYEFSDKFAVGTGLSYLYSRDRLHDVNYHVVGASLIGLYNPIKEMQLSTEFEELNITQKTDVSKDSYWLPSLYLGAAYSMGRHVAMGLRYDVLYDEHKSIYDSALTPFIRVYF